MLDATKSEREVRAGDGTELHTLLVDGREPWPPFSEPAVVLLEVRLFRIRGAASHDGREVPRRVVAIVVEGREELVVKNLDVRIRTSAVRWAHANLVRCELERFVGLPPVLQVLLDTLATHLLRCGRGGGRWSGRRRGHGHESKNERDAGEEVREAHTSASRLGVKSCKP